MRASAKLLALLILLSAPQAVAETAITPKEAPKHIDETVRVKGVVDEVHTSSRGNTFLSLGGFYPNQAFTGYIAAADSAEFPNVHSLQGKLVIIKGEMKLYQGKPEITLRSASQVQPQ